MKTIRRPPGEKSGASSVCPTPSVNRRFPLPLALINPIWSSSSKAIQFPLGEKVGLVGGRILEGNDPLAAGGEGSILGEVGVGDGASLRAVGAARVQVGVA